MAQNSNQDTAWDEDAVYIGRDEVSDFNPDNILPLSADKLAEIREWLQPKEYEEEDSEFKKHLNARLVGTGKWLVESTGYKDWHDGDDSGLLRIRGSGKSVYAASLIQRLRDEGIPVLFFFFRQIIDANHQPVSALHDWLAQLLPFSPPLQTQLTRYITDRRKLESISTVDLWQDLRMALRQVSKVFIVADALDEMDSGDEMQSFLESIAELGRWRPEHTKLIVTSRPVAYVEVSLRKSNAINIRLLENLVDSDIATFVAHRLSFSGINSHDQELIKASVPGRANAGQQVLAALPTDLNVMYDDLLAQHAQRSGLPDKIQLLILKFVTHATRPLRLREIANMINITQYPAEAQNLPAMKQLVRVACGPLLDILPDETVSVIHHSLTEFLTDVTRDENAGNYPILKASTTHEELALLCLKNLELEIIAKDNLTSDYGGRTHAIWDAMRQDTFTRYAGHNWFVHARKAAVAGADQSNLFPILDDMFESQKLADIMVLSGIDGLYEPSSPGGERTVQVTPVYAAALLGLHEYIKVLVSRPDAEVNQGCNPEESPLSYAARKGYADIVDVLLNAGADHARRATKSYSQLAPLHYAVRNNHPEVINLLLAAGADITMDTGFDDWSSVRTCAFEMACTVGHLEALQAVLPFIKSEDLIIRAIFMVAEHGRADMMAAVLAHPLAQSAQVNSKMKHNTPLFLACVYRGPLMVKALLQAGADATILLGHFSDRFAPLFGGRDSNPEPKEYDVDSTKEVFKLLVEAGARITQLDGNLSTPLHYAQDALAARLLVDEGADVDAVDKYGLTILHLTRDPTMMQYLLGEAKASTDLKTAASPPILGRMRDGDDAALEQAQMFLDYGADPSVTDNAGNSALHLLINNNPERDFYGFLGVGEAKVPLMRRFVRSGSDIDARNAKGHTALHLMGMRSQDRKKNSELLEAMLREGADIDATDALGRTPLFFILETSGYLSGSEITDALDEMTRAGAQTSTRDSSGQTLFHAIIMKCDEERIQKLVDRGLDPNATDDCGNTLFHVLAKTGQIFMCGPGSLTSKSHEKLEALGVNPQQANKDWRTPLHITSTNSAFALSSSSSSDVGSSTLFDWFLARQDDVDMMDKDGITALHLASTFSEYMAEKLLQSGADPLKATKEGLNGLHLAARARQTNILGMMLETIKARAQGDEVPPIAELESARHYRSPLFYACASGRPESVKLLLDANIGLQTHGYQNSPLQGVVFFEEELKHWPNGQSFETSYRERDVSSSELALRMLAMSEQRGPEPSERIDEILQLLLESGLATSDGLEEAIKEATAIKAAYTVDCLVRLRERLCADAPLDMRAETAALLKVRADGRRTFEAKIAAGELLSPNEFWKAMKERFFDTVLNGVSPASSVLHMEYHGPGTPLQLLVDGGYSLLLGRVANSEYVAKHDEGTWADTGKWVASDKLLPLLTIACRRAIPNMDMIKVLVETFGVDVNVSNRAVPRIRSRRDEDTASPLHALALGGHWWQAAEGIPYLVAHGANVNTRDVNGRTPLNAVVERVRHSKVRLRHKVIQVLLAHGADVNSVDEDGKSCLDHAMDDPETCELLLKHSKQKPSLKNLIVAITDGKVDMVERLLEAGADPNGREVPAIESFDCDRYGARVLNFCDDEKFPLHHALTCDNSVSVKQEMGELLLKFGADPLARYEKSTLLHEVFSQRYRNVMRWLLDKEIAGIDPNSVDGCGQTLFHLACQYPIENRRAKDDRGDSFYNGPGDRRRSVETLLSLGADIYAKDDHGRTGLHHLLIVSRESNNAEMIRRITARAPGLASEGDANGKTPFHFAVNPESWMGMSSVMQVLLNAGANVMAKDKNGNTPLHIVLGHMFFIRKSTNEVDSASRAAFDRILSGPGANMNSRNNAGETPIFTYIRKGYVVCFDASEVEKTPEKVAASQTAALDMFDAKGVDWTARNNEGETLLHVAVQRDDSLYEEGRRVVTVKYLMGKGLDPMTEDKACRTALDAAASVAADDVLAMFGRES